MFVACVAGEQHELGGRTLADVFELNGWRTSFLGANLPARELVALMQQAERPPDLIALSATMPAHLKQLASTIESIRDSSNVPVMVGGYLFQWVPGAGRPTGRRRMCRRRRIGNRDCQRVGRGARLIS